MSGFINNGVCRVGVNAGWIDGREGDSRRNQQFNENSVTMQNTIMRLAIVLAVCVAEFSSIAIYAADRTLCVIPHTVSDDSLENQVGVSPDEVVGDLGSSGWRAYSRVWKAHRSDPSDPAIRRFLGLPLTSQVQAVPRQGRSAPRWLGWRLGSYVQIDTPHFTIFSRADTEAGQEVAIDLERCYWVWTQMFFPLWEGNAQVSLALGNVTEDVDVAEFLRSSKSRISVRRKMQVVLFRDANEYRQWLGKYVPGVERSTGYYNDKNNTTFLYDAEVPDRATRRHEMVHQLFREATRSTLGRRMPAEKSGFWLVEGIAGYFESLRLGDGVATVGGWDASRIQFARHRTFVGGDVLPFDELAADGRVAAQKRQDIARWYAHAIAQTHHLMDRGDVQSRKWIYQELADIYEIKFDATSVPQPTDVDRNFESFLSVDDDHLRENPISRELSQLCLAGCEVTSAGLATIPPSNALRWLDLSGLPIGMDDVHRLAPNSGTLVQLSLDRTQVGDSIATWLVAAKNLQELDLSSTQADDSTLRATTAGNTIETLWLTGTRVSDESIDLIVNMPLLEVVDLQRTKVSASGIERLRKLRPKLEINPLELQSP